MLFDDINKYIVQNFDKTNPQISIDIREEFGVDMSSEAVRSRKRKLRKKYGDDLSGLPNNTFDIILQQNNFGNTWKSPHGWIKQDGASVFVKNQEDKIDFEKLFEEQLEDIKKYSPKYPKIKREKIKDGLCLVIDIADLHIGKASALEETGHEYNSEEAINRATDGLQGLLNYVSTPIEQIVFVIGNDIMHVDTIHNTTTSGTKTGGEPFWHRMFKSACDTTVSLIETVLPIAPVHVVYCPSNHDYVMGYALAQYVDSWFRKSKDVTTDVSIEHQKFFMYGNTMMMFDHGDGHKENDAPYIMATKRAEMWGKAKHRYSYKHHLHHKKQIKWQAGKDHTGVTIEYLRSPSPPDGWHDKSGYINSQAVEAFIHHNDRGQVMRITHWF